MKTGVGRIVLRIDDGLREVVDPQEVYLLEAVDEQTRVRRHGRKALVDSRSLGELAASFAAHGFFLIHRSYAVNLRRIQQIKRRDRGRDWEVRLEPPVNRVLPVSRESLPGLIEALES